MMGVIVGVGVGNGGGGGFVGAGSAVGSGVFGGGGPGVQVGTGGVGVGSWAGAATAVNRLVATTTTRLKTNKRNHLRMMPSRNFWSGNWTFGIIREDHGLSFADLRPCRATLFTRDESCRFSIA